jgi:hypothetical protein
MEGLKSLQFGELRWKHGISELILTNLCLPAVALAGPSCQNTEAGI